MKKILLSVCFIFSFFNVSYSQPKTEPIKPPINDIYHNLYQKNENPEVKFNKKNDLPRILAPDTMWTDDPRLIFTSFLGGNGYDKIYKSVFDKDKNTIHVGYSGSSNLKVTENAYQPYNRGTYDCLLAKFSPDGKPVFITYYGGNDDDAIWGCDVDDNGNIYVTGWTRSPDFPATDGSSLKGKEDAFISKFSPDGQMIWSKLLGDTAGEWGTKCRIMNNIIILTGTTMSPNFPVSENAYQKTIGSIGQCDAFIIKMTLDGDIIWSTFFGGSWSDGVNCSGVDTFGNITISSIITFVKINPWDQELPFTFPVTEGAFQKDRAGDQDFFIAQFNTEGQLNWATLYGGGGEDWIKDLDVDKDNNIILVGKTIFHFNFPVSDDAYKKYAEGSDGFLLKFNSQGKRLWATLYGGTDSDDLLSVKCNKKNEIWFSGWTQYISQKASSTAIYNESTAMKYGLNVYIAKFTPNGKPDWFTYYRFVVRQNYANSIDVFGDNEFMISGDTESPYMGMKRNSFQPVGDIVSSFDGFIIHANLDATDIISNSNQTYLNITPNPAADYIEISCPPSEKRGSGGVLSPAGGGQGVDLKIYDMLGMEVITPSLRDTPPYQGGEIVRIDVSHLSPGVYFVRVGDKVKKFVKF